MEEQQYENEEQFLNPQPTRPTMLSILCVLSFINAAWSVLQSFCTFAVYDKFQAMLENDDLIEKLEDTFGNQLDTMMNAYKMMFSVDRIYYLIVAILFAASFIGVMYMWKLKKKGFHIYTIAQILILIVGVLLYYSKVAITPWMDVMWTALFVLWYLPFYKKLMQ